MFTEGEHLDSPSSLPFKYEIIYFGHYKIFGRFKKEFRINVFNKRTINLQE